MINFLLKSTKFLKHFPERVCLFVFSDRKQFHVEKLLLIRKQSKEIETPVTTTNIFVKEKPIATKLPAEFHLLETWNASFLELTAEDIQT